MKPIEAEGAISKITIGRTIPAWPDAMSMTQTFWWPQSSTARLLIGAKLHFLEVFNFFKSDIISRMFDRFVIDDLNANPKLLRVFVLN